jgi:type I restriction enzyme R subunit
VLRQLLLDDIRERRRRNVTEARSFAAMLEERVRQYRDRSIDAAQVVEELIEIAKQMREAEGRHEDLGLEEDELAFYDALDVSAPEVEALGKEGLKAIAREVLETCCKNCTIDWSLKENSRAKLRAHVKRLLRKHNYPPDRQQQAAETTLEQAETFGGDWAA